MLHFTVRVRWILQVLAVITIGQPAHAAATGEGLVVQPPAASERMGPGTPLLGPREVPLGSADTVSFGVHIGTMNGFRSRFWNKKETWAVGARGEFGLGYMPDWWTASYQWQKTALLGLEVEWVFDSLRGSGYFGVFLGANDPYDPSDLDQPGFDIGWILGPPRGVRLDLGYGLLDTNLGPGHILRLTYGVAL
jgi:hypothetical protein